MQRTRARRRAKHLHKREEGRPRSPEASTPPSQVPFGLPSTRVIPGFHSNTMMMCRSLGHVGITDPTERAGVFAVGLLAERAGWAFRELPRPDNGIDAQIEARTNGTVNGRLIGLQIRSGLSHFQHPLRNGGGWRYYIPRKHFAYWSRYHIPVLLVLYDPVSETAYWQLVDADTLRSTDKQYALDIPSSNVFDARTGRDLEQIVSDVVISGGAKDAGDGLVEREAIFDLPWMEALQDGDRLFVEAERDEVADNGRCCIRLVAAGDENTLRQWRWTFLPGADFGAQLQKLFPWADKRIDEATYRAAAVPEFLSSTAQWTPSDGVYEYKEDFDAWFNTQHPPGSIKPYGTTADGSTSLWRLELELNEHGRDAIGIAHDEILEEVLGPPWTRDLDRSGKQGGYYTLEFAETPQSRTGGIELLIFDYATEDEDGFERDALFTVSSSISANDALSQEASAAILRHATGRTPTHGLAYAFSARFTGALDTPTGIFKITFEEVQDWLDEIENLAKHGTEGLI